MRKALILLIFAITLVAGIVMVVKRGKRETQPSSSLLIKSHTNFMNIESPVFKLNEAIPSRYTCDGEDVNPALNFSNVPGDAQSLLLIVDDPDAPAGTWVHWALWNISADVKGIKENSVPSGAIQGVTSFGKSGWGGPCPPASPSPSQGGPSGIHHYYFKLYALDIEVKLPPETSISDLEETMAGHILAQAELVGLYSRK